jgi:hypothetical protein
MHGKREKSEFPKVAHSGLDNCCEWRQGHSQMSARSLEGKELAMNSAASSERGFLSEATDTHAVAAAPTGKDAPGQFVPFWVSTRRQ